MRKTTGPAWQDVNGKRLFGEFLSKHHTGGRASKKPAEYQSFVLTLVRRFLSSLEFLPVGENGTDVQFPICGTPVTFDIALRSKHEGGDLVVCECKYYEAKVKAAVVFQFAKQVECLQQTQSCSVKGYIVTTKGYYPGAFRVAKCLGVQLIRATKDLDPHRITILNYIPEANFVEATNFVDLGRLEVHASSRVYANLSNAREDSLTS
jgi:hypothetical protein